MTKFDQNENDLEDEYDFSNSEAAPYAALAGDVHVVTLDGDVWASYPDSASVNAALRGLMMVPPAAASPEHKKVTT